MFAHRSPPTPHARGPASQRGSALIIALVFLLVMTLIGVTAMQGTSQQETMAGNARDRNLAFQAAEAALRAGEDWLDVPSAPLGVTRWNDAEGHTALAAPANWNGAAPVPQPNLPLTGLSGLAADPVFHIDPPMFRSDKPGAIELPRECYRIYPVTAHGTGGTNTATVVLRSTFNPPLGGLVDCPL